MCTGFLKALLQHRHLDTILEADVLRLADSSGLNAKGFEDLLGDVAAGRTTHNRQCTLARCPLLAASPLAAPYSACHQPDCRL